MSGTDFCLRIRNSNSIGIGVLPIFGGAAGLPPVAVAIPPQTALPRNDVGDARIACLALRDLVSQVVLLRWCRHCRCGRHGRGGNLRGNGRRGRRLGCTRSRMRPVAGLVPGPVFVLLCACGLPRGGSGIRRWQQHRFYQGRWRDHRGHGSRRSRWHGDVLRRRRGSAGRPPEPYASSQSHRGAPQESPREGFLP